MKESRSLFVVIVTLTFIIMPFGSYATQDNIINNTNRSHIIKVAIYNGDGDENYYHTFLNYQWTINNKTYIFKSTIIDKKDVLGYGNNPLTNDNFNVLFIGASARSYLLDSLNPRWKNNVKKFIENGGGYLGICGGANAASRGFEKPKNVFHKHVNKGVLGIANVYINDDFLGEWQYLLKRNIEPNYSQNSSEFQGYISMNLSVEKNDGNKIFSDYDKSYRKMGYAGGPGMYNASSSDPKHGKIIPILKFQDELMETHPIHFWRHTLNGWEILKTVPTNLSNTYAGIATTYNNGRIILYSPHPELGLFKDGKLNESHGKGIISRYTNLKSYTYTYRGEIENYSNYWLIRRSIAWVAHIPDKDLPPKDDNMIWLTQPFSYYNAIYINNKYILNSHLFRKTIIFGEIDLIILSEYPEHIKKIELLLDDKLECTFNKSSMKTVLPFYRVLEYRLDKKLFGYHNIKVKSYDTRGSIAYDEVDAWFFNT